MPIATEAQYNSLPEWLKQPYREMVQEAERIRKIPLEERQYGGQRLANIPQEITESQERTRQALGAQRGALSNAESILGQTYVPFTERYKEYMNPYQDQVVRRIAEEGMRNFNENVLPQIEGKFVRLGQHGSSRHADLTRKAARDIQQEILGRQERSLSSGYQQAAQIFSADQARAIEAARAMAHLSGIKQGSEFADIAAQESLGKALQQREQAQLDIAHQDWLRQQEYPSQALAYQSALMRGIPTSGISVGYSQTPGAPEMNTTGNVGRIAAQLLASRMAGSE